jgi:hypothetical protein
MRSRRWREEKNREQPRGCDQAQWSDHRSISTDIRQISGGFEARIALLTGLGNGRLPLAG